MEAGDMTEMHKEERFFFDRAIYRDETGLKQVCAAWIIALSVLLVLVVGTSIASVAAGGNAGLLGVSVQASSESG